MRNAMNSTVSGLENRFECLLDVISINILFFCIITSFSACHLPSSLQQQHLRRSSLQYTAADADQYCDSQLVHVINM